MPHSLQTNMRVVGGVHDPLFEEVGNAVADQAVDLHLLGGGPVPGPPSAGCRTRLVTGSHTGRGTCRWSCAELCRIADEDVRGHDPAGEAVHQDLVAVPLEAALEGPVASSMPGPLTSKGVASPYWPVMQQVLPSTHSMSCPIVMRLGMAWGLMTASGTIPSR